MIEKGDEEYSITVQCELLSLNRTSRYYKKRPCSEEKLKILNAIDEIYTKHPYFGARRMIIELFKRGFEISRPTVAKYMKLLCLEAIYPKLNLSKRNQEHKVYPYLLRNIQASHPNHVWGTDITYIRMKGGFMYLTVFLDWYSRYVISWTISDTLTDDFVILALKEALKTAIPEIANSDQGSQFTGNTYLSLLLENNVKVSMDGRRRALDNIFTERLWRTVKYEDIYLKEYSSPRELRAGLDAYFSWYNNERPHQALNYKTPAQMYFLD